MNNFLSHGEGAFDQSMSTLAVAVGGAAVLAYLAMQGDYDDHPQEKADTFRPESSLNTRFNSGQTYTDVRDAREILDIPGMIVDEEVGQDLSGVQCRWLKMSNGVIIRTYDMQTQFHR